MIIDENKLSSAHNILSTTKLKETQQKQLHHNKRPKRILLQASFISAWGIVMLLPADCRDSNMTALLSKNH